MPGLKKDPNRKTAMDLESSRLRRAIKKNVETAKDRDLLLDKAEAVMENHPDAFKRRHHRGQPKPVRERMRSALVRFLKGQKMYKQNRAVMWDALELYVLAKQHDAVVISNPKLPLFDSGQPELAEEANKMFGSKASVYSFADVPNGVNSEAKSVLVADEDMLEILTQIRDELRELNQRWRIA